MANQIISWIKVRALLSGLSSIDEKKLTDVIESFQRKEFGKEADKAIKATAIKLISVGLELNKRSGV